jgi:hypothetical protein
MATFRNFFYGSNLAVWDEAIGKVLARIESQRQKSINSLYLSTALFDELNDRYGRLTGTVPDKNWSLATFREHIEEIIQAYIIYSSSRRGVEQVVGATTAIPPLFKNINILQRWLLGYQYLPNRFFQRLDGRAVAEEVGPYTLTSDANELIVTVDGKNPQRLVLPTGDKTNLELVSSINTQLVGATAEEFGERFLIKTDNDTESGSILIEEASSTGSLFGFDGYEHPNSAPPPPDTVDGFTTASGTLPIGWGIITDEGGVVSEPINFNESVFGAGIIDINGETPEPFVGLIIPTFITNTSFETDFTGWTEYDSEFYISTDQFRSGAKSLAVVTQSGSRFSISTERKPIPLDCQTVQVTGYHQAELTATVQAGVADTFKWTISDFVPTSATTFPGAQLVDTSADFISSGISIGMAVSVQDSPYGFNGIVTGVSKNSLFVDRWRPNDTSLETEIENSGGTVSFSDNSITDTSKNFASLGIQSGSDYTTRDKVRITIASSQFGQQTSQTVTKDIVGIATTVNPNDTLLIEDWGTFTPDDGSQYEVFRRPSDSTAYTIITSLNELGILLGTASSNISAQFEYILRFFDGNNNETQRRTGFLRPTPGPDYTQFTMSETVPPNTLFTQLSMSVLSDTTGEGALATIDDVTFVCGEVPERGLEFHVAVGNVMQKVVFTNAESSAVGTVTYSGIAPEDGDTITIGDTTYEFDYGARASGVLNYTGNPVAGETFTLNTETFEFAAVSGVLMDSGNRRAIIYTDPDDTFEYLTGLVNDTIISIGTLSIAKQNKTANTVRFVTKVEGEDGDDVIFSISGGTNHYLTPSGGYLAGGSGILFTTSGYVPINMPVELDPDEDGIFLNFASLVNTTNADAIADVDIVTNQVSITAREKGPIGNIVNFSGVSSVNAYVVSGVNDKLSGGTAQNAIGVIQYSGQPSINDTVTVGDTIYKFSTSTIVGDEIELELGADADATFTTLATAIGTYSFEISSAVIDTTEDQIVLTNSTGGLAGNATVLIKSCSVVELPGSSGTFFGGVDSLYVDPNALTCNDVITQINNQTTGLTAYCDALSRVGLRSNVSGVNSCLIVGNGAANPILGFDDASGESNDVNTVKSAWRIKVTDDSGGAYGFWDYGSGPYGGTITIDVFSRSVQAASKFFGTEWYGKIWIKSDASHATAWMHLDFNPGPEYTTSGTGLVLTPSAQVLELTGRDEGRFEDIEFRLTVSGLGPGDSVILSEPFLINRIDQSLHLNRNTTPRNKQREYKLYRMRVADNELSTTEKGLVGVTDAVVGESLELTTGAYTELENQNLFPGSETVRRGGLKSVGYLSYFSQPTDGDLLILGNDIYEFDDDLSVTSSYTRVPIAATVDATFSGLASIINSTSSAVIAESLTGQNNIKIEAQTSGSSGNDTVFASTANLNVISLNPLGGKLEGGVDSGQTFYRDDDYTIRYETGQLTRLADGDIPATSPNDLVVDYSYYPGGVGFTESYTQQVKPVGIKVEPLLTGFFFTHGTEAELNQGSGINFSVVSRTPDKHSHLIPSTRGKRVEVLDTFTHSGGLFVADLDFAANTSSVGNTVVSDGISVPLITSGVTEGWQFTDSTHIALTSGVYDAAATHEFEYSVLFQFTTSGIMVPDSDAGWAMLPYSFRATQVTESKDDVEKVLLLGEDRRSTLQVPAITDKSLSEMERSVGGVSTVISDSEWDFVDSQTVEVLLDGFFEGAIYTIRYKASILNFVSQANETWEYATSADNSSYTAFSSFTPGDVKILDNWMKFRVTVDGDFETTEYRLKSFNALADTAQLVECGFGIEDLGMLPFDLCGYLGLAPTRVSLEASVAGTLTMTGALAAVETGDTEGTVFITDIPIAK